MKKIVVMVVLLLCCFLCLEAWAIEASGYVMIADSTAIQEDLDIPVFDLTIGLDSSIYAVWESPEHKICAQKINVNGTFAWESSFMISEPGYNFNQCFPRIVGIINGGPVVTYSDLSGPNHLYATQLYSNGTINWKVSIDTVDNAFGLGGVVCDSTLIFSWKARTINGINFKRKISTFDTNGNFLSQEIIPLGGDSCFGEQREWALPMIQVSTNYFEAGWFQNKLGLTSPLDLYCQKFSVTTQGIFLGKMVGPITGTTTENIVNPNGLGSIPQLIPGIDGSFWAIAQEGKFYAGDSCKEFFINLIDKNGLPVFSQVSGSILSGRSFKKIIISCCQATPDGNGGVFICWYEIYDNSSSAIYMQHLSATGESLLQQGGVLVATGSNLSFPQMIYAGERLVICWKQTFPSYISVIGEEMSSSGQIISSPVEIFRAAVISSPTYPILKAFFNGERIILVWNGGEAILVSSNNYKKNKLLSSSGSYIQTFGLKLSNQTDVSHWQFYQ